jgi:hypothetical protein
MNPILNLKTTRLPYTRTMARLSTIRIFNGKLDVNRSRQAVISACDQKTESLNKGFGVTKFRLRDWGVSRQRYWGCPIPMINCDSCAARFRFRKNDCPSTLAADVTFDKPGNPLDSSPDMEKRVPARICGKAAVRETDTFDTFFESSWYQFRYCDARKTKTVPIAKDKATDYWMPKNSGRTIYRRRRTRRSAPSLRTLLHQARCAIADTSNAIDASPSPACSHKAWSRTKPTRMRKRQMALPCRS